MSDPIPLVRFEMPGRGCCTTTLQPDPQGQWILYSDLASALADAERRGMERAAASCEAEALIDDERGYYGKEMAKAIRAKATE